MSSKRLTRSEMEAEHPDGLFVAGSTGQYFEGKPEPLRWAFHNCFPRGKVSLLTGAGGSSKSMLVLQLAIEITLAGRLGPFQASKNPGNALLLVAEEDKADTKRRIHAISGRINGAKTRFTKAQIAQICDRLGILSVRGQDWRLMYHDEAGNLQEHPLVDVLISQIREIGGIHFLALDPLVAFNGGHENDNVEMARLMLTLDRIAMETGAAVVVVHHVSKAGQVANLDGATQSMVRGASAIVDNARFAILMTRMPRGDAPAYNIHPDDAGRYVVMRVVKNNYGPHTSDEIFEVGEGGVLIHAPHVLRIFSRTVQSERATQSKSSAFSLLKAMTQLPTATQRKLASETFIGKSQVDRLQRQLLEEGYLRLSRSGRPKYEVTESGRLHVNE